MRERSLVSIVDDDESVRESLPDLLRQFGFATQAFSSAEAFLASTVRLLLLARVAVECLFKPFSEVALLDALKAHRGQVMRKMKADSLPDLVTMAARLGLGSEKH